MTTGRVMRPTTTCPCCVVRTTGKPLWVVSRSTRRRCDTAMRSRKVTTGLAISLDTGSRSSDTAAAGASFKYGTACGAHRKSRLAQEHTQVCASGNPKGTCVVPS